MTNQKVLYEKVLEINDGSGWWEDYKYQIIQCEGCDTISFRKLYNDPSQQQHADVNQSYAVLGLEPL